jgi:hypothetical protein
MPAKAAATVRITGILHATGQGRKANFADETGLLAEWHEVSRKLLFQ